jgi:hypothetical protein
VNYLVIKIIYYIIIRIYLFSIINILAGFNHKLHPENIDLNSIRLCFQVFLEGQESGNFNIPLDPVVSNPIYDKSK